MVEVVVKGSGTGDGMREEDVGWKGMGVGPGWVRFRLWVGHLAGKMLRWNPFE